MANFTIKFSDILKQLYINNKYTFEEQVQKQYDINLMIETADPLKIVKSIRSKFFNFSYDLYDETHKKDLEIKILFYYWDYEIGEETFSKFKFNFVKTFYEILPYYNQLYKAVAKDYDFDVNVDFNEILTGTGSNSARNTATNALHSEDEDVQDNNYEERLRKSDTPQNELQNVEQGKYISEYNYNNNESSTTKQNTLDSENITESNSTGQTTTNTSRTIKGTNTRYSKSKMLKEYFEIIQNVDMKFIDSLKSCFFLLIE